jgi:hypothetical protein
MESSLGARAYPLEIRGSSDDDNLLFADDATPVALEALSDFDDAGAGTG